MTEATEPKQPPTQRVGHERRVSNATVAELTANIRRNIRHMDLELEPGNDRDGRLIDYLAHMDSIAQEIETVLAC
jgi:hypothetical protein